VSADGLHALTALELAAAVRGGETSPREVVEHALARAARLGQRVGAFVTLAAELAHRQARAAEERLVVARREGDLAGLPPFLGVPCPIKDLAAVAGVPASLGSAAFRDLVPEVDDGVVTLLRGAGTVMLGKTTTPELGLPCYTEPDVGPPARTPWDLGRSAGGSSGGAAAAVAAGIVPIAHASDGGGSIRIPASACGLVGLKPSRGRVSWGPYGVDGVGLGTHGVVTRDVADTAAALDVLARPWPGDVYRLPPAGATFLDAARRAPGRLRVGVLTEPVIVAGAPVHPVCREAAVNAGRVLEDLGHVVEPAPVPFPAERWAAFRALWSVGALSAPVPPEREGDLVPLTRWLREAGRSVSGLAYAEAVAAVQALAREVATAWAAFDVVVTPTLAQPPAPVGGLRDDADPAGDFDAQSAYTPWTSIYNLTGAPAISLPLHWARLPAGAVDGPGVLLPIGVMVGARLGEEETLLALAGQLEQAMPWRHRRAPIR
jgi:amidase